MTTFLFFHAHPDDESILTGGSIARLVDDGHRVVIAFATGGEYGEVPDDLGPAETLADRRRREALASADVLGVDRVRWLGYLDSGMTGWAQNTAPGAFAAAPLDEAAGRLAAVLRDERVDVLVTYDWHGNYGHPDHIAVHRVGHAAAQLAGTARVLEATVNRDEVRRLRASASSDADGVTGAADEFDPDAPADDGRPMGEPEAAIAWSYDVRSVIERKRASIACHASQVSDASAFTQMPPELFAAAFGTEWFAERSLAGPPRPLVVARSAPAAEHR